MWFTRDKMHTISHYDLKWLKYNLIPPLTTQNMKFAINESFEASEMWFYIRGKCNLNVFKEAKTQRHLIANIRKRQSLFVGKVTRKWNRTRVVTTGNICESRQRGKQREEILYNLLSWPGKMEENCTCPGPAPAISPPKNAPASCRRSQVVEWNVRPP